MVSGGKDRTLQAITTFAIEKFARPLTAQSRDALIARVLDALGCAIAAAGEADVHAIAAAFPTAEKGGATGLLNGAREAGDAAFLNGMMIRRHDWNDSYVGVNGGHPSDLIPAALAAGEDRGKSGDAILRAIAAGQHVMLDMCDASNALARGWDHGTYVGVAAMVATGLLFDLDAGEFASALAMMAASNNQLIVRSASESGWRRLASPHAARNALLFARLARAGVTGPDPVFEGPQGFFENVSGPMGLALDVARDRSGDTHMKSYPAVFHAQAPIELALAMRSEIVAAIGDDSIASAIDAVTVETHAFAIKWAGSQLHLWEPENRETADHSIAFMTALALARGEIDHHAIDAAIHDASVRELTRKVAVREDAEFSATWPKNAPARLQVTAHGRVFVREIIAGRGHASRPFERANRADKLLRNATAAIGEARARAWIDRLERFDEASSIGPLLAP